MKIAIAVLLTLTLIVSLVAGLQAAKAQAYQTITIKPDGSIEPETDLLERNDSTYTFKGNLFASIEVEKSYITIDGSGYTLQGRKETNERGLKLSYCMDVLVKNLRIYNFSDGVLFTGSYNCRFINNYVERCGVHVMGYGGEIGNLIANNTFKDSGIFIDYNHGGLDVITENNFFNSGILVSLADPPVVDKNYWDNYSSKYPNATEIDSLGIWDTPYFDDILGNGVVIDYRPLVNPVTFKNPYFSNLTPTPSTTIAPTATPTTQATPSPSTTTTPNPTSSPSPTIPEFPSWLILPLIIMIALMVATIIKRKQIKQP
jgi:hypothetical protein